MKLLQLNRQCTLVIGLGLIGSKIHSQLEKRGWKTIAVRKVPWQEQSRIANEVQSALDDANFYCQSLKIIWAAGQCGFGSTEDETHREYCSFNAAFETISAHASKNRGKTTSFFLVSSAGGLFEGQLLVSKTSKISPQRAYGRLKYAIEQKLQSAKNLDVHIYRPSSVFGEVSSSKRMGVIPTLIHNGIRQKVSTISGNMSTLRDYISVESVARFIADEVERIEPVAKSTPIILASGKPYSLFEIAQQIESIIGKKIYAIYDLDPRNSLDNTYRYDAISESLNSESLSIELKRIYLQTLSI